MTDLVVKLLSRKDIKLAAPASREAIEKLAHCYRADFPEALVELWEVSDGVQLPTLNAHIPATAEILKCVAANIDPEYFFDKLFLGRAFVPVLDDHESNYVVANVRPPLSYRISFMPHDDGSRLIYRNLEGMLRMLIAALDDPESVLVPLHLRETVGDYAPDTPRTAADQVCAKELLTTANENEEWNYAIQLLDATNLTEWEFVLETDHFVRRDAVARMQKMSSPLIRAIFDRDQREYRAFIKEVARLAREAGMSADESKPNSLRVDRIWLNLEVFFHRRKRPNAMEKLKMWLKDRADGRDPNERPGNFFED